MMRHQGTLDVGWRRKDWGAINAKKKGLENNEIQVVCTECVDIINLTTYKILRVADYRLTDFARQYVRHPRTQVTHTQRWHHPW